MPGSIRGATHESRVCIGALGLLLAGCYTGLHDGRELGSTGITWTSGADGGDDDAADDGDIAELEPAPAGIRRLLARQYVASIQLLLGDEAAAVAVPPPDDVLGSFGSIAAVELPLAPVSVEQYATSANAIALAVIEHPDRLAQTVPCVVDGPQDDACYATLARDFGHLAWRRPLEPAEIEEIVAIAVQARGVDGDFTDGVKWAIAAMLQAVDFVYVVELGEDGDEPARELTGPELATRMSMVLLGRTPDADLLARAEAGELADDAVVREVAEDMVAQPEARASLVLFFEELLRLPELATRAKNPEMFPQFSPDLAAAMREETLRVVEDVVLDGDDALELLVAEHTFVDARLAPLYGVAAPGEGFARVELPAEQGRVGVLGHASLLANLSHPDRTSPTRRGHFVQKTLLCTEVPPPPADVDTELPEPTESATLRERLEGHMQNPSCAGCHAQMDPIGFAFEHFDAVGAWRTHEGTAPIDASGSIEGLGEFTSAAELAWLLHDDPRVPACLVRNVYRWAVGHLDDEGQAAAMADLSDRFVAAGHGIDALAVELVASPVFRRVGAPK